MEDIHCIREAIARGECEVDFFRQQTATLGEDGEMAMNKIQGKTKESACQPAHILRMIENYCKDLDNRVMLRELPVNLEKGREAERTTQLGTMEAEESKLKLANRRGDMASMMRGRETLSAQLEEYLKGI
jgi:hypothetical protein